MPALLLIARLLVLAAHRLAGVGRLLLELALQTIELGALTRRLLRQTLLLLLHACVQTAPLLLVGLLLLLQLLLVAASQSHSVLIY